MLLNGIFCDTCIKSCLFDWLWLLGSTSLTLTMCHNMWCDLWKPFTCRKRWNCKIKEINIIILMFFFIFYGLWTSVTFDSSTRGDPSKKFWKENNSNFLMIPITQNINFATCDGFSQITSHLWHCIKFLSIVCLHSYMGSGSVPKALITQSLAEWHQLSSRCSNYSQSLDAFSSGHV